MEKETPSELGRNGKVKVNTYETSVTGIDIDTG